MIDGAFTSENTGQINVNIMIGKTSSLSFSRGCIFEVGEFVNPNRGRGVNQKASPHANHNYCASLPVDFSDFSLESRMVSVIFPCFHSLAVIGGRRHCPVIRLPNKINDIFPFLVRLLLTYDMISR